ncbi:MAG: leucine-rich repeat domain-containing protein [Oligoflexia bacterium]|nr:leucine-rich repeat domain-containing protein [Oligoflexia bacterium]
MRTRTLDSRIFFVITPVIFFTLISIFVSTSSPSQASIETPIENKTETKIQTNDDERIKLLYELIDKYIKELREKGPNANKTLQLGVKKITDSELTKILNYLIKELKENELEMLEGLNLIGNEITTLDITTLKKFPNLQSLILIRNKMSKIPPEIKELKGLKKIYLLLNPLRTLPDEMSELDNLTAFDFSKENIIAISTKLKEFFKKFNKDNFYYKIQSMPYKKLEDLHLENCHDSTAEGKEKLFLEGKNIKVLNQGRYGTCYACSIKTLFEQFVKNLKDNPLEEEEELDLLDIILKINDGVFKSGGNVSKSLKKLKGKEILLEKNTSGLKKLNYTNTCSSNDIHEALVGDEKSNKDGFIKCMKIRIKSSLKDSKDSKDSEKKSILTICEEELNSKQYKEEFKSFIRDNLNVISEMVSTDYENIEKFLTKLFSERMITEGKKFKIPDYRYRTRLKLSPSTSQEKIREYLGDNLKRNNFVILSFKRDGKEKISGHALVINGIKETCCGPENNKECFILFHVINSYGEDTKSSGWLLADPFLHSLNPEFQGISK